MERFNSLKRQVIFILIVISIISLTNVAYAWWKKEDKNTQLEELQHRFTWWPTDATPGPVKDPDKGGYWWWPTTPGEITPWGNRGYVYVYKIIFDYKEDELAPPQPNEMRPSLLIKKIIKNVKIYFDYDKAELRDDHTPILRNTVKALVKNPETDILITGNCDQRGSEAYNFKLGKNRAYTVKNYMIEHGISEERIRIISRGKLDAVAELKDIEGMQRDRNAHFVIAEVQEIMIPYPGEPKEPGAKEVAEGKFVVEKKESVETGVKASTREYVVQKGDTLWKIAAREYGGAHRWKYLYELNKDRIKDPNRLKAGQKILIPVE